MNTKLPSCINITPRTSLGFPSWCPESTRPMDSSFQGTSCDNDNDNDNDLFSKLTEQANEIFTETTLYIYIHMLLYTEALKLIHNALYVPY